MQEYDRLVCHSSGGDRQVVPTAKLVGAGLMDSRNAEVQKCRIARPNPINPGNPGNQGGYSGEKGMRR